MGSASNRICSRRTAWLMAFAGEHASVRIGGKRAHASPTLAARR